MNLTCKFPSKHRCDSTVVRWNDAKGYLGYISAAR
jgi:hypothetical protein